MRTCVLFIHWLYYYYFFIYLLLIIVIGYNILSNAATVQQLSGMGLGRGAEGRGLGANN